MMFRIAGGICLLIYGVLMIYGRRSKYDVVTTL